MKRLSRKRSNGLAWPNDSLVWWCHLAADLATLPLLVPPHPAEKYLRHQPLRARRKANL